MFQLQRQPLQLPLKVSILPKELCVKKLKGKNPNIPLDDAKAWRCEALKQRRTLEEFTDFIQQAVTALDQIMEGPVSNDRGRKVAAISNKLELQKDIVRLEALNIVPPKPLAYRPDGRGKKPVAL